MVDVVTEWAKAGELHELLYENNLFMLNETIEGLWNKFFKCKETFESKGFNINLVKSKVMLTGSIEIYGLSKSNVDPCDVCSMRVKSSSVLYVQCGKWIHSRCAGVKRVSA